MRYAFVYREKECVFFIDLKKSLILLPNVTRVDLLYNIVSKWVKSLEKIILK